jgi:transcriptional regulator of acetoin/glycerol metabolism
MRDYARNGYTFDLEENEDRIRCVAAPVRDATGKIKAAISVSSAAHYMDDRRMQSLIEDVRGVADQISRELGWEAPEAAPKKKSRQAAKRSCKASGISRRASTLEQRRRYCAMQLSSAARTSSRHCGIRSNNRLASPDSCSCKARRAWGKPHWSNGSLTRRAPAER